MSSIFTKIRLRQIDAQDVLYEDDKVFLFLTKNPHTEGHTLIVPVLEVPRFDELDDETLSHMSVIAKRYAKVLSSVYESERVGIAIDGFEVDHTHMHIMPIWQEKGGVWKKTANSTPEVTLAELKHVEDKIRRALHLMQ